MPYLEEYRLVKFRPADCGHENCSPEEDEVASGTREWMEELKLKHPSSTIQQKYEYTFTEWRTVR